MITWRGRRGAGGGGATWSAEWRGGGGRTEEHTTHKTSEKNKEKLKHKKEKKPNRTNRPQRLVRFFEPERLLPSAYIGRNTPLPPPLWMRAHRGSLHPWKIRRPSGRPSLRAAPWLIGGGTRLLLRYVMIVTRVTPQLQCNNTAQHVALWHCCVLFVGKQWRVGAN